MTSIHDMQEKAKDEDARADLKRIEQEVVMEAETSVQVDDGCGNEKASVAAAETAFEFEEAQFDQPPMQ